MESINLQKDKCFDYSYVRESKLVPLLFFLYVQIFSRLSLPCFFGLHICTYIELLDSYLSVRPVDQQQNIW